MGKSKSEGLNRWLGRRLFLALLSITILTNGTSTPLHAQNRAEQDSRTVATIGGQPITDEELRKNSATDLENLELQRLQYEAGYVRNRHQVLQNTLDRLIEEKLIALEAATLGITPKELLAREVEERVKSPSTEEAEAFFEANKARINQPKEKVLPQISQFLRRQSTDRLKAEFIRRLQLSHPTISYLEPLRSSVEAAGHPSRGPSNAPVIIVEFSDFQCGFCKTLHATLREILQKYPTTVRLVYRQYPIAEIHPYAMKAAEASLCADAQGHFWELHDQLFQDQEALKVEDLKTKAGKLQLDTAAFNSCLESGKYVSRIKQDLREGAVAGVSGTPALFINGRYLSGAQPFAEIAKIIDDELKRAGEKH